MVFVTVDSQWLFASSSFGMCKEGIFDGKLTSTFCGTPGETLVIRSAH